MPIRRNLAAATIASLVMGLLITVLPEAKPAWAVGGGLDVQIRPDDRSVAWVKSQGFDAWDASVRGGTPNCHIAANQSLNQQFGLSGPGGSCGADNFLAYYSGFLLAPATGLYNFRVLANDAFELRINGAQVLRNWNSTTATSTFTSTVTVNLTAGTAYPISLWYRDFTKEANFKVTWKYPGSGDYADIPIDKLDSNIADLVAGEQRFACSTGIGMSAECPAYSPQEIFDIHGTTANGEYWLLVAGEPTKVHVLMDPVYAGDAGAGYLQLMHIGSSNGGGYTGLSGAGARFNYDSPLWTDQLLTLNAGAGFQNTSKRNTYNFTPLSKVMALFDDAELVGQGAANFSLSKNGNQIIFNTVTGDIQLPDAGRFSPHIWVENVPAFAAGKPALFTFDNQVDQTETVIEPTNDAFPSAGTTSTVRTTLNRIKIPIDATRKNKLLGVIENRTAFKDPYAPNDLSIQAPKTGVFAAAKNPYNEWYGFNFQSREWVAKTPVYFPLMKMRWGFYSMGYQTQFSKIAAGIPVDFSDGFRNSLGEQAASAAYAPSQCNEGGCGQQLQYSFFAPKTRFVALGGIGLTDANAAAYQPYESSLIDVELSSGFYNYNPECRNAGSYVRPGQAGPGYLCAYTTTIYGQMPNPSLANVTGVTASPVTGGFNLNWNAVAGATEYVVSTRKGSEPWKVVRVQNRSSDPVFVAERGPGTYEFKVTARQYNSPTDFNSSAAPSVVSAVVGVGLGGPDQVLVAGSAASLDLDAALSENPLGVSGLAAGTTVGLTVTLTDALKATLPNVTGLSATIGGSQLSGPIELTQQSNTVTVYGNAAAVNNLLADVSYQHIDPANPVGSIRFEAFDAGNSTVKFNPANKHYYSVNSTGSTLSFRNAYCAIATGGTHKTNSDGYDNCNTVTGGGRQDYNGVEGYPATITSRSELNWLVSSGLLSGLQATTNPDAVASANHLWIGATNLTPTSSTDDNLYQWVDIAPTSEKNGTVFDFTKDGSPPISNIAGIQFHKRASTKLSATLLKVNKSGYDPFVFANADSNGGDNVFGMLVEYSEANGGNPLYKSRTISFALAPSITNTPAATATATSATMAVAVDPENSPSTVEVSYRERGQAESENKSAQLSSASFMAAGSTTATFPNLKPITTYDYEIKVTNEGGTDTEIGSFTTGAALAEVLGASALDVTHDSARLGATVRANANSVTSITLQYSVNSNLTGAQTASVSHSGIAGLDGQPAFASVTNLTPETTYYFRTTVVNSVGTSQSEILSFTTGKDLSAITAAINSANPTANAGSNFQITANHPTNFSVNLSSTPSSDLLYASYTIKNISAVTQQGVWVELKDFVGGSVALADPGSSSRFVGDLAAGASKTIYFPLRASVVTDVDQQHVVSVTNGEPGTDADGTASLLKFVFQAVVESANPTDASSTVTDVRFNSSAPTLGGEFKVTATGKIGDLDSFAYLNPVSNSGFPFESLRLDSTTITFPNLVGSSSCPATITGDLLLTNPCYEGQQFEAVFNYQVIGTPTTTFNLAPSVGTDGPGGVSTNDPAETPPVLVNLRPQDTTTVTPSVTTTAATLVPQGGTNYREVEVSVDVDSTSLRSSELDKILVDLGPGAIFDLDSAELVIGGVRTPVNATLIDSANNIVAIDGPIPTSAVSDVKVVFDALIPEGNTPVPIKVAGQIGDTFVGSSPDSSTQLSVTVPTSGTVSTTSSSIADPVVVTALAAVDVFQTTAQLGGKVQDAPQGVSLKFKFGPSSDLVTGANTVNASPSTTSGLSQESFGISLSGLTPGSTYYYQAYYNNNPLGPVQSFTTKSEDEPFVGLLSQPLAAAVICDEPELECAPVNIQPPITSCNGCTLSYSVTSGTLPAGLTLNPATGAITGTPTGPAGNYPFTLTATANEGQQSSSASRSYNLVTSPATAEPALKSSAIGNLSNTSATLTADLAFLPSGELVRVIVKTESSGSTIVNEIIAEGTASASQLVSYNLTGLLPSTAYTVQYQFGGVTTAGETFTTAATAVTPVAPSVTAATAEVDANDVTFSATLANPLPGDTVAFLVSKSSDLTGAFSVIAGSSGTGATQTLTTQLTGLSSGVYFYKVALGDFSSANIYQFTVDASPLAPLNPVSGGGMLVESITPRNLDGCKPIRVVLTGSNLSEAQASLGGVILKTIQSSSTSLTLEIPARTATAGSLDLVLSSSSGVLSIQGAFQVSLSACEAKPSRGFWTKRVSANQIKFYAKSPLGQGKVQFFANGKEVAWIRAIDEKNPKLSFASGSPYLVRGHDLKSGKNRLEIRVNGKRVWRATYAGPAN